MIKLNDDNGTIEAFLYQVTASGDVICVRYGPLQLKLAMEYTDRDREVWIHSTSINSWRCRKPGVDPKVLGKDPELPKPIQLYRMLLGD